MTKLNLKDGTEYQLHSDSTENTLTIILNGESATNVIGTLTESNLSQFSIIGEDGAELAIYKDKEITLPASIAQIENDYILTVNFKNVDLVQKRIRLLEEQNATMQETLDTLVLSTLEPVPTESEE
jgi:hypothetical protein